jgi:putative ABC transport system permease protein
MSVLDRKLVRDLGRMWAQALAIALVMACGVAIIVTAIGAYRSLSETRDVFYGGYRFATIFASLTRAPARLVDALARIEGVIAVEPRVVKSVVLDIEGMIEPAAGIVVSVPDAGEPAVNRLYLRRGRLPMPNRSGEVAILGSFADAHAMTVGSQLSVILNGHKRVLSVTGVVLSPEYIYSMGPGDMVPDPRRFGVLYMPRSVLSNLFDMEGAFNDLAVRTQRGAKLQAVTDAIDHLLKPFGGTGAIGRDKQMSHAFLDNELTQLRAMAAVIPPVFLFVSAFLVNMILTRLVSLEREQVGLMKAVGYGSGAIAWHYGKLTLAISALGIAIGSTAGYLLGRGLTTLYGEFFSFPFLVFQQSLDLYLLAGGVCMAAALAGSSRAIRDVVVLPPAVAMQPPAPARYRSVFGTRGALARHVSQLTMMAMRHLGRWPIRTALTTLGTSFAVAILVTALFSFDSVASMVDTVFFRTERQDATIVFAGERSPDALTGVARLPGVLAVEGFRTAQVVLRSDHGKRRLTIVSVSTNADLLRVLDNDLMPVPVPSSGLLVSERVASLLDLEVGDIVDIELLDHGGRHSETAVTGIVQSYVGLATYMDPSALDRLVGGGARVTGARLSVDPRRLEEHYRAIQSTPAVAGIALQAVSRQRFTETMEQNITIMTTVYVSLAVIITFGVVYNSARIQLSERARELASLRVLGFTRGEVSRVLFIELAVIVLLAQPLGWALGTGFSWSVVRGFESDLFRIPFVTNRSTFAIASIVVISVALLSALVVRRRIDRLNLVRVLKSRD